MNESPARNRLWQAIKSGRAPTPLLVAALAVVYVISARLGLQLASFNPSATAVWPPTGISLVAILLFGRRVWPGVFVGAFVANLLTTTPGTYGGSAYGVSACIAVGNTLEAVAGAWAVNRFARGRDAFLQTRTIIVFLLLAAVLSTTFSATIGVAALLCGGRAYHVDANNYDSVWLTWWIGDMVSNIIIAPALLIWTARPLPRWKAARTAELGILLGLVLLAGLAVFDNWFSSRQRIAIEYLTVPPVLWVGWRFGLRGASAAALALAVVAITGTLHGRGPFAMRDQNEGLQLLQIFAATTAVTAVILASVVAEREQAQAMMRESQFRLSGLVDSAMDAIITVDSAQHIVLYNHAAEKMFGFRAAEMFGQPLNRLLPQRFRTAHSSHIQAFGHTGVTNRRMGALGAISGQRASGEEFPIEASISQTEVGGEKFFTVILRDITERERMETALHEAQKQLRAHAEELERIVEERTARLREAVSDLEAFSYSVSHDLRAPLRVMRQYSEALLEDYSENVGGEGREFLQRIAIAAERLDRLICDVLTYSQVVRGETKLERVDLGKLVPDVIRNYPDLQPFEGRIQIATPLLAVMGSEVFLTQCISNLLGNAVKFVRPGDIPRIKIWTEQRESSVRLWIEDNGIGIDARHKGRIFGIFERLHGQKEYTGTGIGLAIVRKAVERMGGRVDFESEPGRGTKFWIELAAG